MLHALLVLIIFWADASLQAKDFRVNCCDVQNPPAWLLPDRVSALGAEAEGSLHWTIRRVKVQFYSDMPSFNQASSLNFAANAFFSPKDQKIHFSPQKNFEDFARTFRHELVHVIFNQKFKSAIPSWLEEGLANYLGSKRPVDYKWLKTQNLPDVTTLVHPKKDASGSQVHYQLSTATAEMISSRCNLDDLLMLATGAKLTSYLKTLCKIPDVNAAVKDWISAYQLDKPKSRL